jgi:hypothetical protein
MSFAEDFAIGYLKVSDYRNEEIFLSATPHMCYGPGIQRNGLTEPKMTDPHTVPLVVDGKCDRVDLKKFPATTNPFVQRAGTWTLFDHVVNFIDSHGGQYRIIGVQSCGDLTMNPWHVAFMWEGGQPILYHLNTVLDPADIKEPVHERAYRCLIKWRARKRRTFLYEFADLKFTILREKIKVELIRTRKDRNTPEFEAITDDIEFALSGKPIVQKGRDISLSSVIDRFQDVRHVFNLPQVPLRDQKDERKGIINFGEYELFNNPNARRGALTSPIIINLNLPSAYGRVDYDELEKLLTEKFHYRISPDSPTRRCEFRKYSEDQVEIFFPHNVYPFGVLGGEKGNLVCLASGGLSGRVGNTLEGITRIMYDFFGCEDALVLDEGYDTFHILNPNPKAKEQIVDRYKYNNEEFLDQIARFTSWRLKEDVKECSKDERKKESRDRYKLGSNMMKWPLNEYIYTDLLNYCNNNNLQSAPPNELDTVVVEPRRSQMRAALIFAVRKGDGGKQNDQ